MGQLHDQGHHQLEAPRTSLLVWCRRAAPRSGDSSGEWPSDFPPWSTRGSRRGSSCCRAAGRSKGAPPALGCVACRPVVPAGSSACPGRPASGRGRAPRAGTTTAPHGRSGSTVAARSARGSAGRKRLLLRCRRQARAARPHREQVPDAVDQDRAQLCRVDHGRHLGERPGDGRRATPETDPAASAVRSDGCSARARASSSCPRSPHGCVRSHVRVDPAAASDQSPRASTSATAVSTAADNCSCSRSSGCGKPPGATGERGRPAARHVPHHATPSRRQGKCPRRV